MDILILLCLLSWRGTRGQQDHSPNEQKASLGHKAVLPCEAHSHEDSSSPSLQWLYEKNGHQVISTPGPQGTSMEDSNGKSRVRVNKNMQLVIESVQIQDEKIYICRVEDQNGGVKESQVHLRVYKTPDDPEITMEENGIHVTNQTVQLGTCESKNGFPAPNITWYRNNTQLKNGKDGVVVTSQVTTKSNGLISMKSVLSAPVEKSDVYSLFYCDVNYVSAKGFYMKESEKRSITVDYPNTEVKLFVKSQSEVIKEGDAVELICRGDGNPQPQISLHRKDEQIPLSEEPSYSWTVSRRDSGGYVCKALNLDDFLDMTAETELHVHFLDPPLLSQESPLIMELRSILSVSCHVNASAQTDIHWTKDGSTIASSPELSLIIQDYPDAGRYSCVASVTSVPGLTASQELLVVIKGQPQVIISPHEVEAQDGEELTVKCTAIGNPQPRISWYLNGSEVAGLVSNVSDTEVESELTFRVTQRHFNQQVVCKAQNEFNTSMDYIQLEERLKVTEKPVYKDETKDSKSTEAPNTEPVIQKSYGVVIVAVIVCILLLAVLGAVLYFLYKKGHIPCGRSGKKDITKPGEKDHIVVEMKPDSPAEESVLLPGTQDKKQPVDQEKYMDLRN